jgi:hypothetical protein
MLPRRHILDVWEFVKDKNHLLSMATITLAIDAIKHVDPKAKKDHLVEALELNEFICYMFPSMRPNNRSLLFHVVSDLLGLLMYGVPRKSRRGLQNIETIDYSEKNIQIYPVVEVWNAMKDKVYTKKHGAVDVITGFTKKIRIEIDTLDRFPQIEEVFFNTSAQLKEWLPSLGGYYDRKGKSIRSLFDTWWSLWSVGQDRGAIIEAMVRRLAHQAANEFETEIDVPRLLESLSSDRAENRSENELFSRWYREGVNHLLKI